MVERTVTIKTVLRDTATKGVRGLGRALGSFGKDIDRLSQKLSRLTGGFGAILGTGAAVFSARESVQLAERQLGAEAALAQALRGRRDALEEILKATTDIQNASRTGDEVLIEQAALLANMGVSAAEIPRALQAAVDTAAALGIALSGATKGIGLALSVGRAGELGERIGELAQLQAEGRLTAEVLDVLEAKFAGTAGSKIESSFGQSAQLLNSIGDQLERIGPLFSQLQLPVLERLLELITQLADRLSSSELQGTLRVVQQFVPLLVSITTALGGIVATIALVQGAIFLGPAVVLLAKILGIITLVGIGVGVIVAGTLSLAETLAKIFGLVDPSSDVFTEIKDLSAEVLSDVKFIFTEIAEGRLTVEQLFDIIRTNVSIVGNLLKQFILVPLSEARSLAANIFSRGGLSPLAVKRSFDAIKRGFQDALEAAALSQIELTRRISAGVQENVLNLANDAEESTRRARINTERLIDEVEALERLTAGSLAFDGDILGISPEKIRELLEVIGPDSPIRAVLVDELQRQLKEGGLALREFFELREAIEVDFLRSQEERQARSVSNLALQTAELRRQLATTFDQLVQVGFGADAETNPERRLELFQQAEELAVQENELQGRILETERRRTAEAEQLLDTRLKLLEAERAIREERATRLADLESRLQEAETNLSNARTSIDAQRDTGTISRAEATRREAEAARVAAETVAALREELQTLAAVSPELASRIAEVERRITSFQDINLGDTTQTFADFGQGLSAGFENIITRFDNLRTAGIAIGQSLAQGLTQAFTSFFEGGKKGLAEFARTFLAQIGALIQQIIIFRFVSSFFGFAGGGGGGGGGSGAGLGLPPTGGFGVNKGGRIPALSQGGGVPGGGPDRDSVLTHLTPGEHVMRRRAAMYYGRSAMNAINNMLVPRHLLAGFGGASHATMPSMGRNTGGAVSRAGAAPSGSILPLSEELAEMFFGAGADAGRRFLTNNTELIRSIASGRQES